MGKAAMMFTATIHAESRRLSWHLSLASKNLEVKGFICLLWIEPHPSPNQTTGQQLGHNTTCQQWATGSFFRHTLVPHCTGLDQQNPEETQWWKIPVSCVKKNQMNPAETAMAHYTSLYLHWILDLGPQPHSPSGLRRGPAVLPLCCPENLSRSWY